MGAGSEACYISLHPRLGEAGVGAALREQRLEDAVKDAFAEIERAVYELAGELCATSVALVKAAFAPDFGPLSDARATRPERAELQRRYVSAFLRYHSYAYAPANAVTALEAVLVADELMRELDLVAERLGVGAVPSRS